VVGNGRFCPQPASALSIAARLNLEPSDAVGWDGFLYPWTFSVHDFEPLKLSKFAKKLDDGKYAYSWYENAQDGAGAEEAAVDGDASGAGLTSHF
jgi:homogentisate 1,2-dioxygenase